MGVLFKSLRHLRVVQPSQNDFKKIKVLKFRSGIEPVRALS